MIEKNIDCCYNCYYWKDYNTRVHARLANYKGASDGHSLVELRICKFSPPPMLQCPRGNEIYTNGEFMCNEFRRNEK
jgi:hypothetical protein